MRDGPLILELQSPSHVRECLDVEAGRDLILPASDLAYAETPHRPACERWLIRACFPDDTTKALISGVEFSPIHFGTGAIEVGPSRHRRSRGAQRHGRASEDADGLLVGCLVVKGDAAVERHVSSSYLTQPPAVSSNPIDGLNGKANRPIALDRVKRGRDSPSDV